MKIDGNYASLVALNSGKSNGSRASSKAAEGSETVSEVKLSGLASTLSSGGAESGSPVNSARIAELKAAIANGQFKINSSAIADRLLDTARELVQTQRKA